ncbi:long-chain-acyl-CoA synthetase [Agaricicola taiwanensis]|uniref:Long-chain-acyl-CoA synthetase n=1 Tax=Agaricicola taiwanensis TaxID=591372 RepID=A0A8J2VJG5_9RHOB|nr:long-chain-acyl-CoA synthetase [Agaricicola taiwanensis]GGE27199.1 long-chain-acyl-CoA synthetase [Agaricicola taiwanensis]
MGFFTRLRNEWLGLRGSLRTLRLITPIAKNPTRVFPYVFEEIAQRNGDREALISERERFTYRQLDERANRYARWARAQGVGKGDVVALLMLNRPEYVAIWLGITRAGGAVALLNTNLSGASLAHCINIVTPKAVIAGQELAGVLGTARPMLTNGPAVWMFGDADGSDPRLDTLIEEFSAESIPAGERPPITIEDKALFIYTSGTTGMPKAANINHYRLMAMTHGYCGVMNVKPDDRMYDCLPMYHSNGGVLAVGAPLVGGATVVIREKFSARDFWDDVVRWDCTLVFYIGELCRYLVNTPVSPSEAKHRVRAFCGNGLRPDIWAEFKTRFRIPEILEWYAATEGNVAILNFDGTEGAVGRIAKWAERRFVVKIVRFDVETEQPVRGPDGRCIECEPGEVGEVVGQIVNDPNKPANRFEGYADRAATEKKILRDAFAPGDAWFRTGDLMKKDEYGYFFFVDRIGDTFRWKGENVSTSEVAEAINTFPGIKETNVYGVNLKGRDGRAGMAAVVTDGQPLDLIGLREHMEQHLPDYARPLFLRIQPEIEVTGTFKQKKVELVKEGFDPAVVPDAIWFNSPETKRFERLDDEMYRRIQDCEIRL